MMTHMGEAVLFETPAAAVDHVAGESVDEAICYGWIDGIRRSLDETSYTVRFTRAGAAAGGEARPAGEGYSYDSA